MVWLSSYGGRVAKQTNPCSGKKIAVRPRHPPSHVFLAFIGSFLSIFILAIVTHHLKLEGSDLTLIVGSFGAQAVLIFGAPKAPLAQPWNCLVGDAVSAFIGVSCRKVSVASGVDIVENSYLPAAFAVSLSIAAMMLLKALHPPGGASALIAVQGSARVRDLGYTYIAFPVVLGTLIQLAVGCLTDNISSDEVRAFPAQPGGWCPVLVDWLGKSANEEEKAPPPSKKIEMA